MPLPSGKDHYRWSKNPSYNAVHKWLRRHLPKPNVCDSCKLSPPIDVACVTGIYNRDFENWDWLCRSCHNRSHKLKYQSDHKCVVCKSSDTWIKKSGKPLWRYGMCHKCYSKWYKLQLV